MSTNHIPKAISARKVQDRGAAYLTSCDAWTPDIKIAEFLAEKDQNWRLAFANRLHEVKNAALPSPPTHYTQAA
ncbi:MAG: hypothetical protein ABGW81_06930 [Paracoccaceae bacterium]